VVVRGAVWRRVCNVPLTMEHNEGRPHRQDPTTHTIINTQTYKPKDFASQISLSENNMWGVFKNIAEMCLKAGAYTRPLLSTT